MLWSFYVMLFLGVRGLEMPESCGPTQYYDPALFSCQSCLTNSSMIKSLDGEFLICPHAFTNLRFICFLITETLRYALTQFYVLFCSTTGRSFLP